MNIKVLNLDKPSHFHAYRTLYPSLSLIGNELNHKFSHNIEDADCTIISQKDFVFPELSLEDSISKGIEVVQSYENVILYDSTDSTSLQGIIEVLQECDNVKYLVKHQLLPQKDYKTIAPYGKWFFKFAPQEYCKSSYDISDKIWDKIVLSGLNISLWLGHTIYKANKYPRQVFSVFGTLDRINNRFGDDDAYFYNYHRNLAKNALNHKSYNCITNKLEYNEYVATLAQSEVSVSPFGMGELCLRDVESWLYGTALIKPYLGNLQTLPNLWQPNQTFLECRPNFSDLNDKIEQLLDDSYLRSRLIYNARNAIQNLDIKNIILTQWSKILDG